MLWMKAFSKLSNLNWSMVPNSKQESKCAYMYLNILNPGIILKMRFSALGNLTIDESWSQYNLKKESIKNVA